MHACSHEYRNDLFVLSDYLSDCHILCYLCHYFSPFFFCYVMQSISLSEGLLVSWMKQISYTVEAIPDLLFLPDRFSVLRSLSLLYSSFLMLCCNNHHD